MQIAVSPMSFVPQKPDLCSSTSGRKVDFLQYWEEYRPDRASQTDCLIVGNNKRDRRHLNYFEILKIIMKFQRDSSSANNPGFTIASCTRIRSSNLAYEELGHRRYQSTQSINEDFPLTLSFPPSSYILPIPFLTIVSPHTFLGRSIDFILHL